MMQSLNEFAFTLPAPDRVFDTVDSSFQIGKFDCGCGTI
jgi:hypothetical protein